VFGRFPELGPCSKYLLVVATPLNVPDIAIDWTASDDVDVVTVGIPGVPELASPAITGLRRAPEIEPTKREKIM
jgi:hypothetical protein